MNKVLDQEQEHAARTKYERTGNGNNVQPTREILPPERSHTEVQDRK